MRAASPIVMSRFTPAPTVVGCFRGTLHFLKRFARFLYLGKVPNPELFFHANPPKKKNPDDF